MRDFRKIEAWRLADDLTVAVYRESQKFPKEEIYGLTSQLRRASYSVPANVAEGASRDTKRDYLHFLYIARGSLAETRYFPHLASRLGYLSAAAEATLDEQAGHVFGCLHGLIRSVEKESGKLATFAASITSFVALTLAGFGAKVFGP
ncbi:MAG TPA: four helix bundle protein [Opitutus sp.]|nr:four helix bundle protein [Opitutus sp.]